MATNKKVEETVELKETAPAKAPAKTAAAKAPKTIMVEMVADVTMLTDEGEKRKGDIFPIPEENLKSVERFVKIADKVKDAEIVEE